MRLVQSFAIVEELQLLVLQPAICHADNILVHEFLQFRKK